MCFNCGCKEVLNVITSQQQSDGHKLMICTSVALPTIVGTVIDLDTQKQTLTDILLKKQVSGVVGLASLTKKVWKNTLLCLLVSYHASFVSKAVF